MGRQQQRDTDCSDKLLQKSQDSIHFPAKTTKNEGNKRNLKSHSLLIRVWSQGLQSLFTFPSQPPLPSSSASSQPHVDNYNFQRWNSKVKPIFGSFPSEMQVSSATSRALRNQILASGESGESVFVLNLANLANLVNVVIQGN